MHKKFLQHLLVSILLFSSLPRPAFSQQLDYRELFGDDWKKAEAFVDDNRIWMLPLLEKNDISYPLAIAVIFPELVRYSALRDKMETSMLKILYINLGEEYANFSIGHFQMKPSFAEAIREKAPDDLKMKSGISLGKWADYDDIGQYRKSIVNDLEDMKIQLNYLIAFMKICEKEYKLKSMSENDRVKFLSTAYNYGVDRSEEEIESMIGKKFYNTRLFKTNNYSYADVSLYWYNLYFVSKDRSLPRQLNSIPARIVVPRSTWHHGMPLEDFARIRNRGNTPINNYTVIYVTNKKVITWIHR